MQNEVYKNWNNFFLGLAVVLLPWLGLPQGLKNIFFVIFGLLVALFSLARVRPRQPKLPLTGTPVNDADAPTDQS